MTGWTDAARRAALEARRRKASMGPGKRLKPTSWYHGGAPLHGTRVLGRLYENYKTGKQVRGKTHATTSLKTARHFMLTRPDHQAGLTLKRAGLYRVTLFGKRSSGLATQIGRVKYGSLPNYQYGHLRDRSGTGIVNESKRAMRAVRLPRARGRAARGHY